MTASSVTGVSGLGDSNGKYKPQNNCSCSCCPNSVNDNLDKKNKKNSCFIRAKSCQFNYTKINIGNLKIKIC